MSTSIAQHVCTRVFSAPELTLERSGGVLVARFGFANARLAYLVPGARWDYIRNAFILPDTEQTIRALHQICPKLPLAAGQQPPVAAPASPSLVAPPPETPGLRFKTKPWRHQEAALFFALDLFGLRDAKRKISDGALLAMGMGTGKSKVTIDLIENLDARLVLIACPLRVCEVWPEQIEQHASDSYRVLVLGADAGSVQDKRDQAEAAMKLAAVKNQPLVVVINYESMWREPFSSWALTKPWDLVVLDESHRVKEPSGRSSMFVGRLRDRARRRLCLTGTPLPHSPLDIYGQFRFLDQRILGKSFYAFKQRYATYGGFNNKQIVGYRNLEELERIMARITYRVGKEVLDLPPETRVTYHCDLTPAGRRVYHQLDQDFVAGVASGEVTAANAMVKLLRLQQITGGSIKTDDGKEEIVDTAKRDLLTDTLEDLGRDEPVVIFCRFRADIDAAHAAAKAVGMASLELSGRCDDLQSWKGGTAPVLVVQISSGGVGIDLTRARYSIYYSLSFSLGEYDQSLARVHRPGQIRPVTQIHLVARHTVDEKIIRALEKRAEVIDSILTEVRNRGKH